MTNGSASALRIILQSIGVVIIGRNEAERIGQCVRSVQEEAVTVVYVDSGSTDESVNEAGNAGAAVVRLGRHLPYTAARARNAGLECLLRMWPDVKWVQFVDGDCLVAKGWMERAVKELEGKENLAAVCGRRRERRRDESVYNRLCDMEWDTPIGQTKACGGDVMMRVAAIQEAGGYRADLIAGEEPELCVRLRRKGWQIRRIDAEMTQHDAAMERWSQWWKRTMRAGYAYAEGKELHGKGSERYCIREVRSNWLWGVGVIVLGAGLAGISDGWSLAVMLAGYGVLGEKVYRGMRRRGFEKKDAGVYAVFCVMGKWAQAVGQMKYWVGRWRGKGSGLIEYKGEGPEKKSHWSAVIGH